LINGTLAPVIAVIHPLAGTAHPASFYPQLMSRIIQIFYASGLPGTGKEKKLESSRNNDGLDQWERNVEKGEPMGLTSIFGGTSAY